MVKQYIVTINYNPEYKTYEARCVDAPGMFVDCPTLEEAIEVVLDVLPEMLEEEAPAIPLFMIPPSNFAHIH